MLFSFLLASSDVVITTAQTTEVSSDRKERAAIEIQEGKNFFNIGNNTEACQHLEAGITALSGMVADNDPALLTAKVYLGAVYDELSKHADAEILLKSCIENYKAAYPDDKAGVAFAWLHLGKALSQQGKYKQSEEALLNSIGLSDEVATQCQNLVKAQTLLAETYMYGGEYKKAEPFFKSVIAQYPESDAPILWTELRLGRLYMFTGEYTKAKPIFEKGVAFLKTQKVVDNDKLGWNTIYLGDVCRSLGLFNEAEISMLEGLKAFEACGYAPDHQITQWGQGYLGRLYCDLGDYQQAQPILEESLRVHEAKYGKNSKRSVFIMQALGNVYANQGEFVKAQSLLADCLAIYKGQFGEQHTEYAQVQRDNGRLFALQGDNVKAEEQLKAALSVLHAAGHTEVYRCYEYLGDIYAAKGQNKEAAAAYQQACALAETNLVPKSAHIIRIQTKINPTLNA